MLRSNWRALSAGKVRGRMIAGRKLLLADDSAAIQKVIELTFADEGMQVFSVGNGRLALETLEQVAPDVVLADVFMPELNGYDLCRSIKQNERFARTPVMLLVSSFEPFDEDEARRAGADDIVAKPFQSIRQLVNRVGSLLGKSESQESQSSFSTLGLSTADPDSVQESAPVVMTVESEEPPVTVLVEAPVMEAHEVAETHSASCSSDVELQTADTQPLERITDETVEAAEDWQLQDTVEIEPAVSEVQEVRVGNEAAADTVEDYVIATDVSEITSVESITQESTTQESTAQAMPETFAYSAPPPAPVIDESLLDVDEEFVTADSDDVVLDLEFENAIDEAPVEVAHSALVESRVTEVEWHSPEEEPAAASVNDVAAAEPVAPHSVSAVGVPADAIDAIARRVVEQMSEKVVREIVWEVVPELSELLIKQKLNDQR